MSLIEPGGYATEFGQKESGWHGYSNGTYAELRAQVFSSMMQMQRGAPASNSGGMLEVGRRGATAVVHAV